MSATSVSAIPLKEETEKEQTLDFPRKQDNDPSALLNHYMARDTFNLAIVFRFINSLCVWTFFQPDEYFQSLEPAWQLAFGSQSGAWITWACISPPDLSPGSDDIKEWQKQLRSSLHPALFAAVYFIVDKPMEYLGFFPQFRALILSVLPNAVQAIFAGLSDYYTWQLAEKIYGVGSNTAWVALLMTICSPWQWFCATRTFSNSLETTLTIAALNYWPWEMTMDSLNPSGKLTKSQSSTKGSSAPRMFQSSTSIASLRMSLLLAQTACILRPTNLLIWFCILLPTFTRFLSSLSSRPRVPAYDYLVLLREGVLCGLTVLLLSAASDRLYYGEWTFPAYQWLDFNVSQDLAVFYGSNDWHYYISQGLPLLLTTYLPFTLVGLWNSTSGNGLPFLLATTILTTLASLSLISHKEVRFIYPLLPLLHILAAPVVSCFFYTITTITKQPSPVTPPPKDKYSTVTIHAPTVSQQPKTETTLKTRRNPMLITILTINLLIGGYTTLFHQSGVISVMKYIRSEYETLALDAGGTLLSSPLANPVDTQGSRKISDYSDNETFVGFLMPCHSTPWRSKLFYPGLKAWALSCEPPIHLAPHSKERAEYRDEADRFYDDPIKFLKTEINTKGKPWPRYVVGFQGIEEVLKRYYEREMQGFVVKERWRTFNSHWHDDERRSGDVVVWEFVDGSKIQ